jgi:hypothetical protein
MRSNSLLAAVLKASLLQPERDAVDALQQPSGRAQQSALQLVYAPKDVSVVEEDHVAEYEFSGVDLQGLHRPTGVAKTRGQMEALEERAGRLAYGLTPHHVHGVVQPAHRERSVES